MQEDTIYLVDNKGRFEKEDRLESKEVESFEDFVNYFDTHKSRAIEELDVINIDLISKYSGKNYLVAFINPKDPNLDDFLRDYEAIA